MPLPDRASLSIWSSTGVLPHGDDDDGAGSVDMVAIIGAGRGQIAVATWNVIDKLVSVGFRLALDLAAMVSSANSLAALLAK